MSLPPVTARAVFEAYVPCFHLVNSLGQSQRLGPDEVESLRRWIEAQLLDEKRRLIAAGLPPEAVEDVQLPVVALLDEACAQQPAFRGIWTPLSLTLYKHHSLGHEVFRRLANLRRNPATPVEVLSLYARALAWGLQGEFASERLAELEQLKQALNDELRVKAGILPPILAPIGTGKSVQSQWVLRHIWSIGGLLLVLVLCFAGFQLAFSMLASHASDELGRTSDSLKNAAVRHAH